MIWKRKRTKEDLLEDRMINSFQKTGFVNDDLIFKTDRNFWTYFKEFLSDVNTSSIFESILAGYQEVPYNEDLMQKILLGVYKDQDLHTPSEGQVYATTNPMNVRIFRCLFIYSPINFATTVKGVQIRNTINKLREYEKDFKLIPHVMKFLEEQSKIHKYDINEMNNKEKDLFIKNIITLVVPELENGVRYNINGMLRYPYFSEKYHYSKSQLEQIKLTFRAKYKKQRNKYVAYFHSADYEDNGVLRPIFYIKFFSKFCNPFFNFDKHEIEDLMTDLLSNYNLNERTKEILQNTYKMYIDNIDEVREKLGNTVPYITLKNIHQNQDNDADEIVNMLNSMSVDSGSNEDDEGEFETEIEPDEQGEEPEPAQEEAEVKETENKEFRVNRQTISISILKSLILGYNNEVIFGVYSHLSDLLLRITDLNNNGGYSKDSTAVSAKLSPKSLQIVKTISSNADLFGTNTDTHPFDVFHLGMYKKYIHTRDTSPSNKDNRKDVPFRLRFLELGVDYGIIDPTTTKSETSSGLAGNVSLMDYYSKFFETYKK